jgi:polysaccharide export outer membrane protein
MKTRHLLLVLVLIAAGASLAEEAADVEGEAVDVDEAYRIGIEDVLQVVVWGEEDLSLSVTVRPDGFITLPLVNDVRVAGESPSNVAERIREQLSTFIRDPNVTVIVEEINSFRVFVLGEVNNQGALHFRRPTRLLQAIASAGGLTEFSRREAVLLREQHGVEKRIKVNLKHLLAGNPEAENLMLLPNDTVIVF